MRKGLITFLVTWAGLTTQVVAAASDYCAVCGKWLGERVYLVRDEVTNEKKHICADCVTLNTACYFCGMPVKANYTQLPDQRVLCARDA